MARLPPLNALRAFEVASRTGSFTVAARELCVSQGAVSRHIARLEDFLGVKLFERGNREIRLTAEGTQYARELQLVFDSIRQATQRVQGARQRKVVKVTVFPTIAARWLAPRLIRFHRAFPDIDLSIRTTNYSPDLDREDVDIINQRGPSDRASTAYQPLFDIVLRPVCRPGLFGDSPGVVDPEQLSQQMLLHSINRVDDWKAWLDAAGVRSVDAARGLRFDNSALAYQAAASGAGVAMGISDALLDGPDGELAGPFSEAIETGETYGLAWHRTKGREPHVRAFLDWFIGEAEAQRAAGLRAPH